MNDKLTNIPKVFFCYFIFLLFILILSLLVEANMTAKKRSLEWPDVNDFGIDTIPLEKKYDSDE